MGKGNGKGECDSECGKDMGGVNFKSAPGRRAGESSCFVVIMESIGTVVNCYPACCFCCFFPGATGWCLCIWIQLSGIASLIGAAVPCCCVKNGKGLIAMIITSLCSLLIRIIMLIIFAYTTSVFGTNLKHYNSCYLSEKVAKGSLGNRTHTFNLSVQTECETKFLNSTDHRVFAGVLKALYAAVALVAIWLVVSAVGLFFSSAGYFPEERYRRISPGDDLAIVGHVEMVDRHSGVVLATPHQSTAADGVIMATHVRVLQPDERTEDVVATQVGSRVTIPRKMSV